MDALQRTGVFYTITSGNDLAVSQLLVKPMRARGGTTSSLALQEAIVSVKALTRKFRIFKLMINVQTDRTELSSSLCSAGNSSFLETSGYPYTMLNCALSKAYSVAFPSCAMNDFYGIKSVGEHITLVQHS